MEISNGHNQEMALIQYPSPTNFPHMNPQQEINKKAKYQENQAPNSCPRCDSTNTKFCYYNNYSLSQPRYFCKACRRYWTKGGILRNVPVGGGCRKNKQRSSSSSSSSPNSTSNNSSSFTKKSVSQRGGPGQETSLLIKNINITKPPSESIFRLPNDDLTLAFNPFLLDQNPNPNPSFLDILRGGGGVVEPTQQSHGGGAGGFHHHQSLICYGFGGGQRGGMLPFLHGGSDSTPPPLIAAAAPEMAVVRDDDDDEVVGGNHHDNAVAGLGLETGILSRDYWNDSATVPSSSTWHGLVNSSFL